MGNAAIQRRVASGVWERKYRGVFRDLTVPATWHGELMAIVLSKPREIWVSHAAAAQLWDLDGFEPGALEVTTVADIRRCRPTISVHKVASMPRLDVAVVRGIPVTTVHRTLVESRSVCRCRPG